MTVAIFGATGFIGGHLVRRLEGNGVPVLAFGHRAVGDSEISIDFENPTSYSHMLSGTEAVVLLVTRSRPGTLSDRAEVEVTENILPHAKFVDVAISAGVKRVVFVSSGGTVYGRQPDRSPISEGHPLRPMSPYGAGKAMIEGLLSAFFRDSGVSLTTLRPTNPVGVGQRIGREGLVTSAVHAARTGGNLTIWGDGSVVRDYFHVSDLCDAIVLALGDAAAGKTFNVSSAVGTSINEVLDVVEAVSGRKVERTYLPGRETDVPTNVLSYDEINRALGWRPTMSLEQIVKSLWLS
jgi:UDP-glucose 4-epimerase